MSKFLTHWKTYAASAVALAYAALKLLEGDWATAAAVGVPALNAVGIRVQLPDKEPACPSAPPPPSGSQSS